MARAKTIPVTVRENLGVGSVQNTHHQGVSKRPTETKSRLDETTADDLKNSIKKESPMANSSFLDQGSRK
jgi:hypothetical protein